MSASKVEELIAEIETNLEDYLEGVTLAANLKPCFALMREMELAMKEFVDRVDAGEVRSSKTYNQFKQILGL